MATLTQAVEIYLTKKAAASAAEAAAKVAKSERDEAELEVRAKLKTRGRRNGEKPTIRTQGRVLTVSSKTVWSWVNEDLATIEIIAAGAIEALGKPSTRKCREMLVAGTLGDHADAVRALLAESEEEYLSDQADRS